MKLFQNLIQEGKAGAVGRNFIVKYQNQHFYGFWQTSAGDRRYIVQTRDDEKLLSEIRINMPLPEEGVLLYTPEEIQEGKEYFCLKVPQAFVPAGFLCVESGALF